MRKFKTSSFSPIGSMGLVYLPTLSIKINYINIVKSTFRPMDPMGVQLLIFPNTTLPESTCWPFPSLLEQWPGIFCRSGRGSYVLKGCLVVQTGNGLKGGTGKLQVVNQIRGHDLLPTRTIHFQSASDSRFTVT